MYSKSTKKNCRPDNAYRFIGRMTTLESTYPPSTTLMTYNTHVTHKSEFKSLHAKVEKRIRKTKQELNSTRHALKDIII